MSTAAELRTELKFRHNSRFGTFRLWHQENVFLTIMVNGEDAYLLFVPQRAHPGWWATSGRDREEEILFLADNYEPTPMNAEYTVTTVQAERAAVEFLQTAQRPTSVEWVEL